MMTFWDHFKGMQNAGLKKTVEIVLEVEFKCRLVLFMMVLLGTQGNPKSKDLAGAFQPLACEAFCAG